MRLFVYGTLRPSGEGDAVKTLSGYKMHDLGWYPGVVKTGNPDDIIQGNIVPVKDEDHLARLDQYEGCNGNTPGCLYHRVNIMEDQEHLEPVWLYVYNGHPDNRPVVPDGDWLAHQGADAGSNTRMIEGV